MTNFDAVALPVSETSTVEPSPPHAKSNLFGRGLLYVIIWSLQTVAAIVVSPVLAHVLGPGEFGRLASAIALHQVLIVLAVLGIDQALVLQRAEDSDGRAARGLAAVALLLASVVTLVVGLTGPWWASQLGFGSFSSLVLATVLWTAPAAGVQVMLALLLSEDRLRPFAFISALSAVGGQVCGLVLMFTISRDAGTYAWGGVFSQFAAVAIAVIVTRPRLAGLFDRKVVGRAVRLGVPLALGGLSYFVLNAGDRIVVQRLLGAVEVGRYQVAYTVGYIVVLLLTFTSQAWAPRFASVRDEAERVRMMGASRDELYRLLLPMTLGLTLIAPFVLRVVAPPSYRPGSLLVVVFLVALSAFPVAAMGASARALIVLRRGPTLAVIAAIAAAANVALNLLLVPRIGIVGSAGATILAFTLQAFLQYRSVPAIPPWPRTATGLWLQIGLVCGLSEASVLLPQTPAWSIARVVIAITVCAPWFVVRLVKARRAV